MHFLFLRQGLLFIKDYAVTIFYCELCEVLSMSIIFMNNRSNCTEVANVIKARHHCKMIYQKWSLFQRIRAVQGRQVWIVVDTARRC